MQWRACERPTARACSRAPHFLLHFASPCLSLLGAVYKFIRQNYTRQKRLRPSAALELWILGCLLPLLRANTSIELSPPVTAVGSCREQTEHGFGGFSVAERNWSSESVSRAAMWEERWRYKHLKTDDPVKPRQIVIDHLLAPHMTPKDIGVDSSGTYTFDPTLPSSEYSRTLEHIPDFVDLPAHELATTWRVVVAGAWKYDEVIHVAEACSVLVAARRLCRVRRMFG